MAKCRVCKTEFKKFNMAHICCSSDCAIKYVRIQKSKDFDKETRARKTALKSKGDHTKEAQAAFNKFIRLRDQGEPCISCGRHHQGQYHAGHYRTVGANPELRFEELNCHKQCSACNNHLSGNLINYRINLANKIGKKSLNWLEGPHGPKNYTIEDIKEIKKVYRAKCRELEKQQAA